MAVAKKTASAASCAETGEAWQRTQQDETPNAVIGRFERLKSHNGSLPQFLDGLAFCWIALLERFFAQKTPAGKRLLQDASGCCWLRCRLLESFEGRRAAVLCRLSRQPLNHGVSNLFACAPGLSTCRDAFRRTSVAKPDSGNSPSQNSAPSVLCDNKHISAARPPSCFTRLTTARIRSMGAGRAALEPSNETHAV